MSAVAFDPGGCRFALGVFQYSAGVAAQPGYRIVRVQFRKPVPIDEGFRRIERIIQSANRPLSAFCACELRSPALFRKVASLRSTGPTSVRCSAGRFSMA